MNVMVFSAVVVIFKIRLLTPKMAEYPTFRTVFYTR